MELNAAWCRGRGGRKDQVGRDDEARGRNGGRLWRVPHLGIPTLDNVWVTLEFHTVEAVMPSAEAGAYGSQRALGRPSTAWSGEAVAVG